MKKLKDKGICQICLREIGAKAGVIAHHGYQRPNRGSGWQTSSCFGARYKPLEVSCDAIPKYIDMLKNFCANQTAARDTLLNDPPEVIKVLPQFGGRLPIEYKRPAGFKAQENVQRATHTYRTYECEHADRFRTHERHVKDATAEIKLMQERLAAWKPPKTRNTKVSK